MTHRIFSKILFLLLLLAFFTEAQAQENNCGEESQKIYYMMERHHIKAEYPNDSLSINIYKEVLETLDPYGLIFLQSDIDSLSRYTYRIDNEILEKSNNFFLAFSSLYTLRTSEMMLLLERIILEDIELNKKDTLFFGDSEPVEYSSSKETREFRYKRYLKMKVLSRIFERDSSADSVFTIRFDDAQDLCVEEFERVKHREKRKLGYYQNHSMGYESIMKLLYLNMITAYYDPHSMYFNQEMNKWFQGIVNASTYSFGFTLEEDLNGNVKIYSLLPGGSAWKSNSIHKGDVLLAGTWQGSERQDFTMMSIGEIENFLEQSVDKRFTLELRKSNGQTVKLELKKEIIQEDEDIVHSYILENNHKLGLIILPSFYTDYDENTSGCSNDVAKEIMKLKKEGVKGIILDLRFNGGGSIQEALDLVGIFIDAGPVCMVSDNTNKPFSLKDRNRGTVWDGPLVILVNAYSASASEIVAAALQDHNRAVIAGQNTYGKASGQVVMPLDTCIKKDFSNIKYSKKVDAYIKLTRIHIYRISGQSCQLSGMSPDIIFPSLYEPETEKDELHALPNIPASKKSYYTPLAALPLDSIRALYYKKVQNDSLYINIRLMNDTIDVLMDSPYQLFDFESWQKMELNMIRTEEYFAEKLSDYDYNFSIMNHTYDMSLIEGDDFFSISNEASLERIKTDYEIQDAIFIMEKLIELLK